jgi:uncharacterized repeat protein (TIGR03803 family)
VNRVFYGSTLYGGGSDCRSRDAEGCGTLFELAPSGKERVLYRFLGKTQGAMPISGLTHLKDAFTEKLRVVVWENAVTRVINIAAADYSSNGANLNP